VSNDFTDVLDTIIKEPGTGVASNNLNI